MIRLAVVGTKGAGRTHIRAIRSLPECELVAACDVDPEEARACSEEEGVPCWDDLDEMLNKGKLDGITVCTPHPSRAAVTVKAFEAGVHVLVESPMAVSVGDAERMIASGRKAGRWLGVVFLHRTGAVARKAREVVASGEIGEIHRTMLTVAAFRTEAHFRGDERRGTWEGEGGGVLLN